MAHRRVHRVEVTDGSEESYRRHGADASSAAGADQDVDAGSGSASPAQNLTEEALPEAAAVSAGAVAPDQDTAVEDADPQNVPTLELQDLQKALDAANKRADQEHELYLRVRADFANYKRRQEEQQASMRSFAARELILKILNVVDDFERAQRSAAETQNFEALSEGLSKTVEKLQEVLEAEGVKPIEAVGQPFDPMFHEAVMRIEDSEHPENTVVSELQKGYTMKDEVIRPAMVTVAVEV
ncbi:MAG: nucleotide exchange factor GrpE [Armatimonadetes bacterium]|nr:nucleotide exchange factor GrpE [Armatimonadota bacterium]